MSEKYIDLLTDIAEDKARVSFADQAAIHSALSWLDDHPDQVPGRTITESELYDRFNSTDSLQAVAEGWGITVVPHSAPEPTSAERVKITDTEAYELYESARSFSLDDFKLALESIDGIETVDDTEPTNAEKLAEALRQTNPAHGSDLHDIKGLSEALDEAGVKAPGGDDER